MTSPFLARLASIKSATTAQAQAQAQAQAPDPIKEESKPLTFAERLAAIKGQQATRVPAPKPEPKPLAAAVAASNQPPSSENGIGQELVYREAAGTIVFNTGDYPIRLNDKQMLAVDLASEGKSFVLTGAAGTGKTTSQAGVVWALHNSGAFRTHDFKYIGEAPSIAAVAFTKVAVRNMQRALRRNPLIEQYANHCMTVHSLLEFEPVDYEDFNDEGELVQKWGFKPQRTASNPLKLTHLIIEEASMVDLGLWRQLFDALPQDVQIIFLGDINQIRPVFGDSILIYALTKLPIIELTEVYRQALESPIISNAHNILNGKSLVGSGDGKFNIVEGRLQVKVGQEQMAKAMLANFKFMAENGVYDPETDMILSPWNKQPMGTKAINEGIATWLGLERKAEVVQVKAGRNQWWLAVGDKVLVDKRLGHITAIEENPRYTGGATARGVFTRCGMPIIGAQAEKDALNVEDIDLDSLLEDYSDFTLGDVEEDANSRASSHRVSVVFVDDDTATPETIDTAGSFADDKFQFGYCLTVHKAQGSEWPRVFMLFHWDHASTVNRNLLYTAVTRAAEEFTIFGKQASIDAAIARAAYRGKTLADKIAYFKATPGFQDDVPLLSKIITD